MTTYLKNTFLGIEIESNRNRDRPHALLIIDPQQKKRNTNFQYFILTKKESVNFLHNIYSSNRVTIGEDPKKKTF